MLDDDQVLALRAATAARLAGEAAQRGKALALHGTRDDDVGPARLTLWLIDDAGKVEEIDDDDGWGAVDELIDALGAWLGSLPWGERGAAYYRQPVVRATPEGQTTWFPLSEPRLDRWRGLAKVELPPRIRALQRQADAAEVLRDAVLEDLPDAGPLTLARVWLGDNAHLVPRSGLRFDHGIPSEIELYFEDGDAIDREMPLPWSARPRVHFMHGSRVEMWPALAAAPRFAMTLRDARRLRGNTVPIDELELRVFPSDDRSILEHLGPVRSVKLVEAK